MSAESAVSFVSSVVVDAEYDDSENQLESELRLSRVSRGRGLAEAA